MSAELSYEIWAELKHHINIVDVSSAASSMIAILVDNDIDADEIRAAFKSDTDIKRALKQYLDDEVAEEDIDPEEFDDDDDEDD
jgi:hypothetical protein